MGDGPALPGVFGSLAPVLNDYGYFALGGIVLLEDFGIPVPGETILIAASIYAGAHHLNITAVVVIAFVAAVIGDNIGYAIGRFGGRQLALRAGRYVLLTDKRLARAEHWFDRHGGKIVTVARFIEGLRQLNGIIAGIVMMPWRRFIAFNALGAALWVGVFSALGYLAGNRIDSIYETGSRYSPYALALVALAVLAFIIHTRARRRAHQAVANALADPTPDQPT
ncbi:DedA family protein [Frankia sp. Cppng1_Ct_nod]|uniref:DedA family protein n=1 Tax=Frankia sp. Cppng1_Ct_nod TaxID=2897162 RepID=UPI0010415705|nr:DedA family protein [Frankia sp. Cppng1_Ct_nod]